MKKLKSFLDTIISSSEHSKWECQANSIGAMVSREEYIQYEFDENMPAYVFVDAESFELPANKEPIRRSYDIPVAKIRFLSKNAKVEDGASTGEEEVWYHLRRGGRANFRNFLFHRENDIIILDGVGGYLIPLMGSERIDNESAFQFYMRRLMMIESSLADGVIGPIGKRYAWLIDGCFSRADLLDDIEDVVYKQSNVSKKGDLLSSIKALVADVKDKERDIEDMARFNIEKGAQLNIITNDNSEAILSQLNVLQEEMAMSQMAIERMQRNLREMMETSRATVTHIIHNVGECVQIGEGAIGVIKNEDKVEPNEKK